MTDIGAQARSEVAPDQDQTRDAAWTFVRDGLRSRGLRWTPQRRTLVEVLSSTDEHVTGAELVERCRAIDPTTIPSTVYRTLDVLEELGYLSHHHGVDGRAEFHVRPHQEHGHVHCTSCGTSFEISVHESDAIARLFGDTRGFAVDRSHVAIAGLCAACRADA